MTSLRLPLAAFALFASVPVRSADPLEAAFDRDVKPFLKQYCARCHNADKQTSGVRVDHLDAKLEDRHLNLWEHVLNQTKTGTMPPEEAKQPTAAERKKVVEWAEQALKTAKLRPVPKNGSVRRLTVAQYRNTLRELLLLEDNVAESLPPDAVSRDGFVNNQDTLQISPLLLEAYFDIADQALSRCVVDPKAKPVIQNFRLDIGAGINAKPIPGNLVLGADSLLLDKRDVTVEQLKPGKSFAYEPFAMRTKYRFIEGYQGNDTVRGWRDFDSIYHSVFACMRGSHGYPKGRAYSTVPQGLLLRPAIPSSEIFGQDSTYGPKANFKIALRELPENGRFRVTVLAARYDDGLLLDPGVKPAETDQTVVCRDLKSPQTVTIKHAGIYQVDVHAAKGAKPAEFTLTLGERHFTATPNQPAFLAVRLPKGELPVSVKGAAPERITFTPLAADHELAKRFAAFEKRSPQLGVHMGFRRDCGSTLAPVGEPQAIRDTKLVKFVFEGAIQNYPDPNVEKDNVNYLAGIREIGVRSEYTDGRDMPRLLIRSVEFEGPLYDAWPPATHRNIFTTPDQTPDAARKVIRDFATRAFRRPVTGEEETAFVAVFEKATKGGARYHDAVKDALQVVLTSPQFLFLIEASKTPDAEPLDNYELASKLSYFLWNGPPDAALLKLAASGELPKKLDAEVARMIADPRFTRFTGEFATQWLSLDKFAVLEPDRKRFPTLTRDTRRELGQEPVRFLEHLMRNNLPARNLIASDFVMANEVVASYYGLADKTETGFRFEPVRHGRRDLGGLLTQPAILAGLSDGRESNPVKRGAWLARKIVAEPPDDPPPNVPALKEDARSLTLRERLERHRNQPGCAQCHTKVDPWGVPFEEFDAAGLFKTAKVDARSTLPDKTEVADFAALRKYLADDRADQVAFSVLKHLAIYATGRNLTYAELEFLRKDALRLKADGYRMQDMIRYVVNSKMFLEK
jgi:mono/diheme cytochrome c family protein